MLENEDRCRCVVEFLRDVAYFDVDRETNYRDRPIDDVDKAKDNNNTKDESAAALSFSILHSILSKRSELRTEAIASRFILPGLLFWICGNSKQAISGSMPQVLKDIRELIVLFIGYRLQNAVRYKFWLFSLISTRSFSLSANSSCNVICEY